MKYVIVNDGWDTDPVPCAHVFSEEIGHKMVVDMNTQVMSAGFCNVVDGRMIVQVGRPSDSLNIGPAPNDGDLLTKLILQGKEPMDIVRERRDANE
jgi:hypothetical protein